jgi:Xaa-Pro aminopeptidase
MSAERAATLAKPELASRLERIRAGMARQGIDALWIGQSTDLEYVLGVDRRIHYYGATHFFGEWAVGAVIREHGDPLLLVPRHMAEFHFDVSAEPPPMRVFTEKDDPRDVVREAFAGGARRIGINADAPAELVLNLQELFPNAAVALAANLLARTRSVKSDAELEAMRTACRLVDQVWIESLSRLQPDLTEFDLAAWIVSRMKELGAIDESFDTAVWTMGPNEQRPPKERLSRRPIGTGTSLSYDFGAALAGYCSDFGRTVHLGRPSDRFVRAYNAVIESAAAGAAAMKPGVPASDVDAAARQVIVEAGFGDHFRHRLGHAIGKDVHEPPYLDIVDSTALENGMTFTIEPSIFITGEFGARVEDIYVVTDSCGVRLNEASHQLVAI